MVDNYNVVFKYCLKPTACSSLKKIHNVDDVQTDTEVFAVLMLLNVFFL